MSSRLYRIVFSVMLLALVAGPASAIDCDELPSWLSAIAEPLGLCDAPADPPPAQAQAEPESGPLIDPNG
ncbi:MAG: hypothetical protein AAGN46_05580 [Acidobacteriota bacterium]